MRRFFSLSCTIVLTCTGNIFEVLTNSVELYKHIQIMNNIGNLDFHGNNLVN